MNKYYKKYLKNYYKHTKYNVIIPPFHALSFCAIFSQHSLTFHYPFLHLFKPNFLHPSNSSPSHEFYLLFTLLYFYQIVPSLIKFHNLFYYSFHPFTVINSDQFFNSFFNKWVWVCNFISFKWVTQLNPLISGF